MTEYDSDEKPSPEEVAEDRAYFASLNWFVIELTIFPNPANAGLMEHWDLYDLRFVPANAKIPKGFEDISDSQEYTFDEAFVIINGQPCDPEEGKFLGPRRLRIIAGFPKNLSELKFRYYFEQFGLIHLPKNLRSLTNQ